MLQDLKVFILTWNVKGSQPQDDYGQLLALDEACLPDVYFLGFQELAVRPSSALFEDQWITKLSSLLAQYDFVRLTYVRLQGILLAAFCKRHRIMDVRSLETAFTRTGLKGYWGNKGAVSMRLTICGVSICVVDSHLAAHDHNVEQRISEYRTIIESQSFDNHDASSILTHDYVFWLGDLNFRMDDLSGEQINQIIIKAKTAESDEGRRQCIDELLSHDQLTKVKNGGRAFAELTESSPTFLPTYRFIAKTSTYDYKSRKPAYTDRILFRSVPDTYNGVQLNIKQLNYQSHEQYVQSDHKPVTSLFSVKALTSRAYSTLNLTRPLKVAFLPVLSWRVHSDCKATYTVTTPLPFHDVDRAHIDDISMIPGLSCWDWVALYKHDFSSLDDYITYVWASSRPQLDAPTPATESEDQLSPTLPPIEENENEASNAIGPWFEIIFPDSVLLVPNKCRLLYFNQFGSVLGMSSPFTIEG